MDSTFPRRETVAGRVSRQSPRPRSSVEEELAVVAEELAAARALYATFDPDSPPWAAEAELRRLELRWHDLAASVPPVPSPTGGTSSLQRMLSAVR